MKRLFLFLFLIPVISGIRAQLTDIRIIIPKDIGYSQSDFLQYFQNEKYFVTAGNAISVFNTETSELLDEYPLNFGTKSLSVSEDNKYILVTVANNLLVFTFDQQKLELYAQISSGEITNGIEGTEYYKDLPIGSAFFLKGHEAYIAISSFVVLYDLEKKEKISHHSLGIGTYVYNAAYNRKTGDIFLSATINNTPGLYKHRIEQPDKTEKIIEQSTTIYKMKMCDSLLMCFDTDKYFVFNTANNTIIHEITLPLSNNLGLDKKAMEIANKRVPITTPDKTNFAADEYILDMDFIRSKKQIVYATSKEMKIYDPLTKKIIRREKGIFSGIRVSPSGNRMVGNGYMFYKALRVYNPTNMSLIAERNTMGNPIYSASMSPNKKWLYTNGTNSGFIWDLSNFTKFAEIKDISGSDSSFIMNVYFLNDSEVVVNSGLSFTKLNLFIYNFKKKEVKQIIKKNVYAVTSGFLNGEFYYADFSHLYIMNLQTKKEEVYEGMFSLAAVPTYKIINFTKDLVFVPESGKFSVVDRKTKSKIYESETWAINTKVIFSDDGNYLYTTAQINRKQSMNGVEFDSPVNAFVKIDLKQRKITGDYAGTLYPYDIRLINNGKTIGMWYVKYDLANYKPDVNEIMYSEYDTETGKEIYSKKIDTTPKMMPFHYTSETGKYFGLNDVYSDYFKIFDAKGDELISLSKLSVSNPKCFFDEEKDLLIITSAFASMATFVDLKEKKVIGQLANAEGDQFFLISSDLHYLGSKEFVKSIRFKHKNEIFGFEQFDAYLNQPHEVLKAFSCTDTTLIQAYEKAYTKRLKLLGIKPGTKVNFAALPAFQQVKMREEKTGLVNFSVSINKGANNLQQFKVYNNGSLIHTEMIPAEKQSRFEANLNFETSSGINRFEFLAVDAQGLESPHVTRYYNNTNMVKPNLYMAVIASEKFKNSDFDLAYAVKDANDMANAMSNSKSFDKVIIKKMFNKSFSNDSIPELKKFFATAGVNDVIMVFFAGHGFLDTDFSYYFPTYYTDFNDPKVNSVSYNKFEKLLQDVKPLRKLMFIDACFSGEVDVEETHFEKTNGEKDSTRSASTTTAVFAQGTALEMSKTVFSDLRESSGATVISSAGGTEAAFEGEKWNNGLFTHCVLEGMKNLKADYNLDNKISLSELQKYVADEVYRLSEGRQMPTYRLENTVLDYELW